MAYDKKLLREYSLNVPLLRVGEQSEAFQISDSFFEHFEHSIVKKADLNLELTIQKTSRHMDTNWHFTGWVELNCDRCGEAYNQPIDAMHRLIYSFEESAKFEDEEVVSADQEDNKLSLIQEIYDFIHLSLPMRQVPDPEIHICSEEVLKRLGLIEDEGNSSEEEEEIDPRWAALKKLKDQMD